MLYDVTEAAGGGGGGGEARDTESKTRTPHKDVGNRMYIMIPINSINIPSLGSYMHGVTGLLWDNSRIIMG
jgi:hypothetical protein